MQSGERSLLVFYACHGSHSVGDRFSANASAPAPDRLIDARAWPCLGCG